MIPTCIFMHLAVPASSAEWIVQRQPGACSTRNTVMQPSVATSTLTLPPAICRQAVTSSNTMRSLISLQFAVNLANRVGKSTQLLPKLGEW